jgi:predicted alpha/beta superfamily hydrolase
VNSYDQFLFDGPCGDYLKQHTQAFYPELQRKGVGGGAQHFLNFLVKDVKPQLESQYRLDPLDQVLFGFSAGGTFATYALLTRPDAFAGYICGSPALNLSNYQLFGLEEQYAKEHDDMATSVYFAAGEAEMALHPYSAFGGVSSMARMVETLCTRQYPSLRLHGQIFPGETHDSVEPLVLNWGVRAMWGTKVTRRPI